MGAAIVVTRPGRQNDLAAPLLSVSQIKCGVVDW